MVLRVDVVIAVLLTYNAEVRQEPLQPAIKDFSVWTAVSGSGEISLLRRLLISLYNLLGDSLVKSEIKRLKSKPFLYPAGPFYGSDQNSLSYMTSTMYDEEEDVEINVKYICSCDEYVYSMKAEGSFACIHCDSECSFPNCLLCQSLRERDLWSDANL